MSIYDYESRFGAADKTTKAMKSAIEEWFQLYYLADAQEDRDPSQRIAYTVVNKLVKAMFGEYAAVAADGSYQQLVDALDAHKRNAAQLALVGGECYLKPCPGVDRFDFTLIPRNNVLIFAKDADGTPTDVGTMECSAYGKYFYTLLERRTVDGDGYLTIENKLYRSADQNALGTQVGLSEHPDYALLQESYRFEAPLGGTGLVRMKTPMLNCVDGSSDGVSVYAAVAGLIRNIDENEAQMNGEFSRGESRVILSSDMLRDGQLQDHLFVGLDEDPEAVGMTVYSPNLRYDAYLARKQEYLRSVESLVGMRRGMLSDANMEERTATEITSSAGDFNLTVIELQKMWEAAQAEVLTLCGKLAQLYQLPFPEDMAATVDWGNSTLYDEDKVWEEYRQMVSMGLVAPEVALGWRFNLPANTEAERQLIRDRYMPNTMTEAP